MKFSVDDLAIDCASEVERISATLTKHVLERFKKRGFVLGLSGGVDSSVVAALCVNAVGKDRVFGLLMPERESSRDSLILGTLIADYLEIRTENFDITDILEATGCYRRRDEAIRSDISAYDSDYKCKLVRPSLLEDDAYMMFSIEVESPTGERTKKRLSKQTYLNILSASNFKQRVRKMLEYFHADRLNYAVAGTPNRQEYDQGFFVKIGDGSADTKPIAHLYKTQVYQLAEYLGVPKQICVRGPTTDTYPIPQSQEEFFFSLPYQQMDLCLFGLKHGVPTEDVAIATNLTTDQVKRVYRDIESKRKASEYLHSSAVLVED